MGAVVHAWCWQAAAAATRIMKSADFSQQVVIHVLLL
jgi:hypothetical protein